MLDASSSLKHSNSFGPGARLNVSVPRESILRDSDGVAHIVGLSGGKDSTCLALRERELCPNRPYNYICTPTGDELPEMVAHWESLERRLSAPLIRLTMIDASGQTVTLTALIEHFKTLPNFRMRWCTRLLKILPTELFIRALSAEGPVLNYVGLRADEETREGIYSQHVTSVFPLREAGMALADVLKFLADRCVSIPRRTDCARCYHQRLVEWKILDEQHPTLYDDAVRQEQETGYTFRTPGRDQWPTALEGLRVELRSGRELRGEQAYRDRLEQGEGSCRVCSL